MTDDSVEKTLRTMGWVILISCVAPFWSAWVLGRLWAWFLVPVGAPALSLASLFGIALTVRFVTHQETWSKKVDTPGAIARCITDGFVSPTIVLGIGWVTRWIGSA